MEFDHLKDLHLSLLTTSSITFHRDSHPQKLNYVYEKSSNILK